ncbi:MAG: DUF2244 domain-containing protein [Pseudomonadales bacterium]|nr:DUF2244 domain-containing protein [Pseudomonadales bacterium]
MVSTNLDTKARTWRIVLRPNQSWGWHANLYILYTLIAVSTSIGLTFAVMGAWPVLPWSMLEMLVLALCLYHCAVQCNRQEVLTITEDKVILERGLRRPSESHVYHRVWSRFLIERPPHPWDPARVSIRSHGQQEEIGSFLSQRDKSALITELRDIVSTLQDT